MPDDNGIQDTGNSTVEGSAYTGMQSSGGTETTTTTTPSMSGNWKTGLSTDLRNAPFLQKFEDTTEGLGKAIESYGNLEKLLGHEKVPIPKGDDDAEGWNRFKKAMGIPERAAEYGLPDAQIPKELQNAGVNKERFAEIVHAHKLTPAQAKSLWKTYNDINVETYNKAMESHQKAMTETINRLKGEWGDAYETNVELGQMTINKFSDDQEMNDFLTATLAQDPRGIKFLAKIGNQFAENKVGEFQIKRFSKAPEEAKMEWQKIVRDPNHPYNNDKALPQERQAAIDYVNALIATATKG